MKKILLICFDNPYLKPNEGGKNGMKSRILSLLNLDIELDIILLNKQIEGMAQELNGLENKVHLIKQFVMNKIKIKYLMSKYPVCVNKRYVAKCVDHLKDKEYDAVIYEGEHTLLYRIKNIVKSKKHILYMHDIESEYRKEIAKATRNPIKKLLQYNESKKFNSIEKNIDKLFDSIMFVSKDECVKLSNSSTHSKDYIYVPLPSVYCVEKAELGEREHKILYVGDLTIENNILSLIWFCQKVFSKIENQINDVEFRIIGRISERNKKRLQDISHNINILGYVDNLSIEYHKASFFACPILYGAGVKSKAIDAIARGQLVIGTTKVIEGTELTNNKHVLVNDNPKELTNICVDVLKNRNCYTNLINSGFDFIKKNHSIKNQSNIISKLI